MTWWARPASQDIKPAPGGAQPRETGYSKMKAFLVLLLGALLCVEPGSSLQCFNCSSQLSNSNCMSKEECGEADMCRTEVIRVVGLFSIISKGCDSSCKEDYQDFKVGNRNISCCSTELCNINAAGSVRSSYGLAGGLAAGVLCTLLSSKF